ncbi:PREDICTED: uncharacterized protein LOC109239579 [Nicotiana attenuata]|uniref:uncharacterized protein LOC109239579 n=1 Tax=Nicotiana attenuata TaxID=49451 RepID=UPI000904FEE1|nr:PREDICTED: uncharacterized protein LOC109239579 [Nicotiana attenuata]
MKFWTVELDDELIVKILFGCPALEAMGLNDFYGFHILEIGRSNKNLKTLKLHNFWPYYEEGGDYHSLEIAAPYLQHLKISGHLLDPKCVRTEKSQVGFGHVEDDSCRDYHAAFCTLVEEYLHKLGHVTELTIGTWFAEVLFKLQLDNVQLPELKCKCLTLKLHITKYNLYGVASLLRASPHLETLNIDMDVDTENHDRLFELSKFLLKDAMALEKFVIRSKRKCCSLCSRYCVSSYSSGLAAKLLGCPRRSTKFVMIFQES